MIQFDILTGTKAGTRWVTRLSPFQAGRGKEAALSIPDDGVWERHFEVSVRRGEGVFLAPLADALTLVNGEPAAKPVRLRGGDLIDAGSARLRFNLSPTRQASLAWREVATWLAIGAVCAGQLVLIYSQLP